MKLNKLTKGLLASLALVAGSASADVYTTATIDITNLKLDIYSDAAGQNQLVPVQDFGFVGTPSIDFNGTGVATVLNGSADGASYVTTETNAFAPIVFDLDSTQMAPLSAVHANSAINGNIFTTGADGLTTSYVDVGGVDTGDANSEISNALEAAFDFTMATDAYVDVSFNWLFDVLISVTEGGGIGNANWGFEIDLVEQCTGFCAPTTLYSFDLNNDELFGISSSGTIGIEDSPYVYNATGSDSSGLIALTGGTEYSLKVVQTANASAASVSEPMSLGFFALGLLGVAGLARRKQA